MTSEDIKPWIPLISAFVGSGGLIGSVKLWAMMRPEVGQITVVAARGAVVLSEKVIKNLEIEIDRLGNRIRFLENEHDGCEGRFVMMEDYLRTFNHIGEFDAFVRTVQAKKKNDDANRSK